MATDIALDDLDRGILAAIGSATEGGGDLTTAEALRPELAARGLEPTDGELFERLYQLRDDRGWVRFFGAWSTELRSIMRVALTGLAPRVGVIDGAASLTGVGMLRVTGDVIEESLVYEDAATGEIRLRGDVVHEALETLERPLTTDEWTTLAKLTLAFLCTFVTAVKAPESVWAIIPAGIAFHDMATLLIRAWNASRQG